MNAPLLESRLSSLKFIHRGKVRDLYQVDAERLLIIQTDRLSAFDVILPTPVPGKGEVLTALSLFWFRRLAQIIPNHLLDIDPVSLVRADERDQVAGRAMVVRRLQPLPIEAIVRGYLAGSGWKEYQQTGAICGIALPAGLREADQLPGPIFTPSTKAPAGTHDQNIPFSEAQRLLGPERAAQVRDTAIALYSHAADYARTRGVIIADTKFEFGIGGFEFGIGGFEFGIGGFEFGIDGFEFGTGGFEFGTGPQGQLYLIDEALTPDSSRFWPAAQYRPGTSPPSFDKQFVRDWLEAQKWDKKPPAPALPPDVLARTAEKYREALRLLTGR